MPDAPWPRLGCSQLLGRSAARLHLPSKYSASSPPPRPRLARGCRACGPAPSRAPPSGPRGGDTPRHTPRRRPVPGPGAPPPSPSSASPVRRLLVGRARSALFPPASVPSPRLARVTLCPCSPTHTEAAPAPDWPTPSVPPDSPFCSSRPSRADARERDFTPRGFLLTGELLGRANKKALV